MKAPKWFRSVVYRGIGCYHDDTYWTTGAKDELPDDLSEGPLMDWLFTWFLTMFASWQVCAVVGAIWLASVVRTLFQMMIG